MSETKVKWHKYPDEPMHAGNVEVAKGCIKDKAEAEKLCAELNEEVE